MNTNEQLNAFGEEDIAKSLEDTDVRGKTFGNYRIGREIGEGGMGRVYEAHDISLNRPVVVKMVKFHSKGLDHRKMMITRFQREAQAACRVLHQNVAVTFAFLELDGQHMLVMERIEGRTLLSEITTEVGTRRALEPKRAVSIVIDVLKGLEAIHAVNILHRDLKPGNVMLTRKDDQVKILDFGLGKLTEASDNPAYDMTLTQHDVPIGSPPYMSPEQIRSLALDARSDIYSVGVILYQLLAGKQPFVGKNPMETYDLHRSAPIPLLFASAAGPALPALQAIVRKALAKEPDGRYGTAAEMRAALEAVDFDAKASVKTAPLPKPRTMLLPIAALGICAAIAGGLALASSMKAPKRTLDPVAKIEVGAPAKAYVAEKRNEGIEIPSPPPAAATVAQGCEHYERGRTTDAIATLTRALATKPNDAKGLHCLCGSYVRQPESAAEARKACTAYRRHPERDADKTRQVDFWLRRLKR